jgi:pimeloyl-ACP methyl ester carboxylesterase
MERPQGRRQRTVRARRPDPAGRCTKGNPTASTPEPIMQSFSSSGVEIAFIDEPPAAPDGPGQGAAVVLVHGFASTHAVNWVNTHWTRTLAAAGYRVIALDNRGHGRSARLYDPADYATRRMAGDVLGLLDHLGIGRAVVMGYSMGARIAAVTALDHPARVRGLILGGLGIHLVDGAGLPPNIAEAMEARSRADLDDIVQRSFRAFAEANRQDLRAMAACMRGSRMTLTPAEVGRIACPTLVAVGGRDSIAGAPEPLAALFPRGRAVTIGQRDHNLAVGDKIYKAAVLEFLAGLDS